MKFKGITSALLLAVIMASCSSTDEKRHVGKEATVNHAEMKKTTQAVARNNGEYYAVLEFDKGTQGLSNSSKRDLKEFIMSAQKEGREIDDIKILAWADKEYPAKETALSDRDVKMATERTKSIEKYLKDDLKTDGNYATYNMAKRPNKVSEFFRGDDYKTKRIFEKSGAAPAGTQMTSFMNSKASKALIMIDYEEVE
ncbi:MAG: hypothetical protein K2Q18_12910 [Bdellovibrionales bacterium]|nr:hypothetical protein [Bdellovibrionales bacterium]